MKPESSLLGFCGVAAAMALIPRPLLADGWWFEAGPVWRVGMSLKMDHPSTLAQRAGLLGATVAGPLAAPAGMGATGAYADRTYDNGYVFRDVNTGTATSPNDPNTTWNWGGGQYANGILSFTKQGNPADTSARPNRDETWGAGLQIAAGLPLTQGAKWSLDLSLDFQGIFGSKAQLRQSVSQVTVRDSYDVSGVANFPAGGFNGTYLGPFDTPAVIPSPVIPNLPTARATSTAVDSVLLDMDLSLYRFGLGPQIGYAASDRLQFRLRPLVSLNITDVRLHRTEMFQPNAWYHHSRESQVAVGLGVTAGADLDLGKGFYTGAFGGYEWITRPAKVTVGPNSGTIDASGFVAGAVLGKRF
jgi:hypothetical protein